MADPTDRSRGGRAHNLEATSVASLRQAGASQGSLREFNLGLVLGCILDSPKPVSRADIAIVTGLARATVSALVDLLIAAEMVAELDPVFTKRAGRPAVPLVPASRTMAGVGLEVNIDYFGVRAVDLAGNVVVEQIVTGNFRQTDPAQVLGHLSLVAGEVFESLDKQGIRIVGSCLALPGLVDREAGPLRLAPNLGWRDADLTGLLDHPIFDELGVLLANEANLAARAEGRALKRDEPSFLYVSGEVGIGGALVHEGKVFVGEHGWSGELGHTLIDPRGPDCPCGAQGCLEQYAGKDAMFASAGLDRDRPIDDLIAAAHAGEQRALDALDRGGHALGIALSNFVNLTDVNTVILGGIYDPLIDLLQEPIERELRRRVLSNPWSTVRVHRATAGPQAAMTGAALAVLGMVVSDPSAWCAKEVGDQEN